MSVNGTVVAVSRSPQHGFSKQIQPVIRLIAGEGVEGDAHRGVTVKHRYLVRRDPTQPNLSQVHLFAEEMLDELKAAGFAVGAGEIGENVLTRGLDLLALPQRTLLRLGAQATLQLTGLRTPCSQIDGYREGLQTHLWGERDAEGKRSRRAGVMAIVLTGGEVRPGDAIGVELPVGEHRALEPV